MESDALFRSINGVGSDVSRTLPNGLSFPGVSSTHDPRPLDFQLPKLERVVSGPNSIDAIADEIDRRRLSRIVIVTGRTLGASPLLERVRRPVGERCAAVFTGARQHVPSGTVAELAGLLERQKADGVVSFGGGSPIDTVKGALLTLLGPGAHDPSSDGPPHLAIPTTLSAGEFTDVAGITDEKTRIKRAVRDPRIAPRTVFTDPTVTFETPGWLWAASGIRAIDHAVESMYSSRHHPLSDATASRGLSMLIQHLPPSISTAGSEQLEHRARCQIAAWMSVLGMTNAGFGLSHALGHQIGPRWDVPHGVTSCIVLPHAMRLMAEAVPERFEPIAGGLGVPFDAAAAQPAALACADRVAAFIAQFDMPRRLRDVQVPSEGLDEVAAVVHDIMSSAHVHDRLVSKEQIASLLEAAY